MNSNSITVIIPTFERVESTITAVESALSQSLQPDEIYVIDDGSGESFVAELQDRISKLNESRVRIIFSSALRHPGKIRNIGIEASRSRWIAFLDSDDYWLPNKLELQLKLMQENNFLACSTQTLQWLDSNSLDRTMPEVVSVDFAQLVKENSIVNSGVLIERGLLESVGNIVDDYHVRGVEDYATWLRVGSLTKWGLINHALVFYSGNSPDSIRRESAGNGEFDMAFAHLNFLLWKKGSPLNRIQRKFLRGVIAIIVKSSENWQ